MNFTKKDIKVILTILAIGIVLGFFLGRSSKRCPECNLDTIKITENEKKITDSTSADDGWLEWIDRNSTRY